MQPSRSSISDTIKSFEKNETAIIPAGVHDDSDDIQDTRQKLDHQVEDSDP